MKKANLWIVGTLLLITLFHYLDTAISGDDRLQYLSLAYLAAFVISMFMTRKSKACNLFYLIYSFVLCVAIVISLMKALVLGSKTFSFVYYLALALIEPFISLALFLWGGTDWNSMLSVLSGIVLLYLIPFVTMAISFHLYTKNHCK